MRKLWLFWQLGVALSFLWLVFPASILAETEDSGLDPQSEAALYALSGLGPVDLNPKTVQVEVYVSPDLEMQGFLRLLPEVWPRVQRFYRRLDVNLVQTPGRGAPGALTPARHLRLEVLPHQQWLQRSFQAFKVAPPFRFRFLKVCEDKYAFAHLPLSVIHFSFGHFNRDILSSEPGAEPQNRQWLANLLSHELGHLLGLYHAHEFVNDPIPEMLPDGKTPNFMSHHLAEAGELGFVGFQKLLVHSYLSQGKVYQQYRQVEFDPLRYLELIKRHNGFREPNPHKKAPRVESQACQGLEDDEDEEEEDGGPA